MESEAAAALAAAVVEAAAAATVETAALVGEAAAAAAEEEEGEAAAAAAKGKRTALPGLGGTPQSRLSQKAVGQYPAAQYMCNLYSRSKEGRERSTTKKNLESR